MRHALVEPMVLLLSFALFVGQPAGQSSSNGQRQPPGDGAPAQDPIAEFLTLWPTMAASIRNSRFAIESMTQDLDGSTPDQLRADTFERMIDTVLAERRWPSMYEDVVRGLMRAPNVTEEKNGDVIKFRGLPSYRTHARFRHGCYPGHVHMEWARLDFIDRRESDETVVLTAPEFVLQSDSAQECIHVLRPNQWRTRKDPAAMFSPFPMGRGASRLPDARRCGDGMAMPWTSTWLGVAKDGLPVFWALGEFDGLGQVERTGAALAAQVLPKAAVFVIADYGDRRCLPFPEVMLKVRRKPRGDLPVIVETVEVMRFGDVGVTTGAAAIAVPMHWSIFDHTIGDAKTLAPANLSSSPHGWARCLSAVAGAQSAHMVGDVLPAVTPEATAAKEPSLQGQGARAQWWLVGLGAAAVVLAAVLVLRHRAITPVAMFLLVALLCGCAGDVQASVEVVHDAGAIRPTGSYLEHEFSIVPAQSVVATDVVTSCGCVTTVAAPVAMAAGVPLRIPLRMGIAQSSGVVEQSVQLRAGSRPIVTLKLRAEVLRDYRVMPPSLYFGPLLPGATDHRVVTFSGSMRGVGVEPPSPLENFCVEPVALSKAGSFAFDVKAIAPDQPGKHSGTLTFTVAVADGRHETREVPVTFEVSEPISLIDRIVTLGSDKERTASFRIRDAVSAVEAYCVDAPAGIETTVTRVSSDLLEVVAHRTMASRAGLHRLMIKNAGANFMAQVVLNVISG